MENAGLVVQLKVVEENNSFAVAGGCSSTTYDTHGRKQTRLDKNGETDVGCFYEVDYAVENIDNGDFLSVKSYENHE